MSPMEAFPRSDDNLMVRSGIEQIAQDLFAISGTDKATGLDFSHRMIVIRLPATRNLIVYSPFSPSMVDLSSLGTVTAVVAPNAFHDTYVHAFLEAHPTAKLYSSPALKIKYPEKDWGTVLHASRDERTICTDVLFKTISGFKALQEVVLLHVATGTIIASDLGFNYRRKVLMDMPFKSPLFLVGTKGINPFGWSATIKKIIKKDCKNAIRQLHDMVERWSWDRYIMCHGQVVHENAKQLFRDGLYRHVRNVADGSTSLLGVSAAAMTSVAIALGAAYYGQ